ncbi:MAG: hypothetical protein AB8F26_10785 [Phycisphaerales bacterium]
MTTLPEGGMIPLFMALAAGLALWLAGVKLVRVVFLSVGAAIGGFAGAVLIPLVGLPTFNLGPIAISPGFTGLIVGGVIGSLVALGMLRVVITFTAAGAFAVAGAMAALVFLNFSPSPSGPSEPEILEPDRAPLVDFSEQINNRAAKEITDAVDGLSERVPENSAASDLIDDLNTDENRQRIRDAAERSKEFVTNAWEAAQAEYGRRPARDKLVIASSTFAGLGLGLLLGVAMPKRSSALVTSLFGSAMWMGAAVALVRANTDPTPALIEQSVAVWAIAWGVVTVMGMAVQFGLIKRRGNASEDGDDDE